MQVDSRSCQFLFKCMVIFILAMIMPEFVWAKWQLEQTQDGNWISMKTAAGHQLIVSEDKQKTQFLLILEVPQNAPQVPLEAELRIDNSDTIKTQLKLLQKQPYAMAFRIMVASHEEPVFVAGMIDGLELEIIFGKEKDALHSLHFSLLGYTDAYTDLQIANDIERLDLQWLSENGKHKELNCYLKAKLFTLALRERMQGKSYKQVRVILPNVGIKEVDSDTDKILASTFKLPTKELPRHSSAKKYTIFNACMTDKLPWR